VVQSSANFTLYFDGIVGSSYTGDIAIDDVSLTPGVCQGSGGCDFESGLCTWTNARSGDDFDWLTGTGQTSSQFTGPTADHTRGDANGNKE
jgi:hypothetical protein